MCDESTPSAPPVTPEIEQAEAAMRSAIDSTGGCWTEDCQQAAVDLARAMDQAGWPAERKVDVLCSAGLSAQGAWDIVEANTTLLDVAPEDADPLCPHCLASLDPLEHLCPSCGGPVDAQANMDPLQSIYAAGWAYRNAAQGRPSRIIMVAMWLIFGPAALFLVWVVPELVAEFVYSIRSAITDGDFLGVVMISVGAAIVIGLVAIYAALLYRVTMGCLRSRQEPGDD
ncbi:MAG: hypothetical protein ACLFTN_05865 [Phycisphaerae bacterium]